MVIEKAKRLVESRKDVVILLDSITRLARAHNTVIAESAARSCRAALDAKALEKPKKFFGAARNIDDGGSLTIIATALVETGSRMDEVIFEEFKGTGNMELVLGARDRRAAHLSRRSTSTGRARARKSCSSPRRSCNRVTLLRTFLADMPEAEAIEFLLKQMSRSKNNREFFVADARGVTHDHDDAGRPRPLDGDRLRGAAHRAGDQRPDRHDRVSPPGVIERRAGKRPPVAELVRRADGTRGARDSSWGCPSTARARTPRARIECRRVAAELARRTRCPWRCVDERFTTAAALRAVRDMGGTHARPEG